MPAVVDSDRPAAGARTKGEPWRSAKIISPKRPFVLADDGYPAPTELELLEGAAHLAAHEARLAVDACPQSRILRDELHAANDAYRVIWFRLQDTEGLPAINRCAACHVVFWGRTRVSGCGACGCKEAFVYEIRRFKDGID